MEMMPKNNGVKILLHWFPKEALVTLLHAVFRFCQVSYCIDCFERMGGVLWYFMGCFLG